MTNEDVREIADKHLRYQESDYDSSGVYDFARAIEARVHEELRKQESDRIHIAGLIDPLTRTQHPDNLTMAVAAKLLRDTAPLPTPIQQEALMRVNLIGTPVEVIPMDRDLLRDFILARPDTEGSGK